MMDQPLQGQHILIPRPIEKTDSLSQRIRAAGGRAYPLPVVAVRPRQPTLRAQLDFSRYDWLIFTSTYAVDYSRPWWENQLPPHVKVAAIGPKTYSALKASHFNRVIVPEMGSGSESLLAHPALQSVQSQHFAIIGGKGGRQLLSRRLRQRGAQVDKIACYERYCHEKVLTQNELPWHPDQLDWVIGTSAACLCNLLKRIPKSYRAPLRKTPIIVMSQRLAKSAEQLGFTRTPVVAVEGNEEAIVETMVQTLRGGTEYGTTKPIRKAAL